MLKGANLFLIEAVSASPHFEKSTAVPDGFAAETLSVPHPRGGRLYLRLRDDPAAVSTLLTAPEAQAGKAPEPRAAAAPSA
jgi:hypothetical protein